MFALLNSDERATHTRFPFADDAGRARLPALVAGLTASTGSRHRFTKAPLRLPLAHSARVMVAIGLRMWLVPNHASGTPCTSALCGKIVSELIPCRYRSTQKARRQRAATCAACLAPSIGTLPPAAWPDSSVCRLSIPLHCNCASCVSVPLHFEVVKSDETG